MRLNFRPQMMRRQDSMEPGLRANGGLSHLTARLRRAPRGDRVHTDCDHRLPGAARRHRETDIRGYGRIRERSGTDLLSGEPEVVPLISIRESRGRREPHFRVPEPAGSIGVRSRSSPVAHSGPTTAIRAEAVDALRWRVQETAMSMTSRAAATAMRGIRECLALRGQSSAGISSPSNGPRARRTDCR